MAAIASRLLTRLFSSWRTTRYGLVIASIAFVSGALTGTDPQIAVWLIGFMILCGIVVRALYSIKFAWVFFFSAMCANGVLFSLGPLTLRLEFFALPILGLSVWAQTRRTDTDGRRRRPDIVIIVMMCAWPLFAVVTSVLNAPDPGPSVWMALQLGFAVLAAAIVSRVQLSGSYLFNSASWILGIMSMLGVTAYIMKIGFSIDTVFVYQPGVDQRAINPDSQARLVGLAFEPNIMGSLTVAWLGALYYQHRIQGIPRGFIRLAAAATMIAAFLTGTRAAWVAILVMAALVLISYAKRSAKLATFVGLAILAGGLISQYSIWGASASGDSGWTWRITHMVDAAEGTGLYRTDMWRLAMSDISSGRHSLFWGTGSNSFAQFHQVDATGVTTPYLSSLWVGMLYDQGLFGLTLFILLILMVAKRLPTLAAAMPMFAALAICGAVTNLIWFAYPWVFVALLFKMRRSPSDDIPTGRHDAIRTDQLERSLRQE